MKVEQAKAGAYGSGIRVERSGFRVQGLGMLFPIKQNPIEQHGK